MKYAKFVLALSALAAGAPIPAARAADEVPWTLESATARVIEVVPERRAADADVATRAAELRQAGSWPNPMVDLRADDKLGQEDGRGGANFTELALSQPLPLRRVPREKRVAEARLTGAGERRRLVGLELERAAAQSFHDLQLATAKLELARARQKDTERYPGAAGARDRLVRYLAPLERARLAILREEARQAVAVAEREYEQVRIAFRARLALPPDARVQAVPQTEPPAPPALDAFERNLDAHPLLVASRREQEAAELGISAARSQRTADPALNLFRERDFLGGARRDVTGVGVSVQVPVWNTNPGVVDKARAGALRARTDYDIALRDARMRVAQAHTQLARTLEQIEAVRTNLLEPAQRLHTLAHRSFGAGEANVLTLVDATNSYYDAEGRYLELVAQAQQAAAELRLAAGQSLLAAETTR